MKVIKYKISDLDRHLELLLMNRVYKKITPKIKEDEKAWLEKSIKNYKLKSPEFYVLAICLGKKIIGNVVLEKINSKKNNLGFWIGKEYQKKGYATKAVNLFVKKIMRKFKPKMIYAETKIKNLGAQKVLENNGFKQMKKLKGRLIFRK
jgi:RimJ/RimL family protein N-acetyltransferase